MSDVLDLRARYDGIVAKPPAEIRPRPDRTTGPVLTRLSDVTPSAIRWIWAGWLALGKITIADGDPGLGKSLITVDLAARVTRGKAMPNGEHGAVYEKPAGVVFMTAEDDPADTLRPRLDAAGADVERVVLLDGIRDARGERMPSLVDLDALRIAIADVDAKLVIVDPLMAYLGGDAHRDNEVRQSLTPLAKLAAELGVAVLVVRHLNKSGGVNSVYRGGGSIGIIGAARVGWIIARDPDDETKRVLACSKSNLDERPGSISFAIEMATAARIRWEGPSSHSANALLAVDSSEQSTQRDQAREWLLNEIAEGGTLVEELRTSAREAGYSWRTVERARATVSAIKARRVGGRTGSWMWVLDPTNLVKDRQEPKAANGGL